MKWGEARCGTPSGWSRHQRNNEKPCDACAAAKAAYDRRRRSASEVTRQSRLAARAQGKANTALRRAHPDEYAAYYEAAKAELFNQANEVKS